MYLTRSTSLILDILRLAAALTVAYYHFFLLLFSKNNYFLEIFSDLAHFSVIIFFVLSGYLIGYTTTNNNRGLKKYLTARFSRLYSVLFPVLIIMFVIEKTIGFINYSSIAGLTRGMSIVRYIMSGMFLNEIWFFSAAPPLNAPLWSLSFEFWFYIVFGLWFFRQKNNWKLTALFILSILISGPKILTMFPIWIFGMLAFKLPKIKIKKGRTIIIAILSIVTLFVLFKMPALPFEIGTKPMYFAGQFIKDWLLGLLLGTLFWLLPLIQIKQESSPLINRFRKLADLTYTIYLIHLPLIYLFIQFIDLNKINLVRFFIYSSLIIIISGSLGYVLESKRKFWNLLFEKLFSKLKFI